MTREEAIEKLELMRQKVDEETYRALILAIKALEQRPKTGHWIYNRHKQGVTCSECDAYRKYFGFFEFYCPNCGTRMSDEPCIEKEMPCVTEEEMQKCKEIVKKYTQELRCEDGK